MKSQEVYTIKKVQEDESPQVIDFMMSIRSEIFPMLSKDQLPPDLLHFQSFYLQRKNAIVYAAYSQSRQVLGTIGVCPYDDRFSQLQTFYGDWSTAEIVKCYVDPQARRLGIGTRLFQEALQFCCDVGYQKLYLHTHLFLPGALSFWKTKGFAERWAEDDPVWQTVHLDMEL
ncbi:GNAT family N-acetyltransferase [Lederbergia sp. NSJ-179]|uniref:GNAT family N-acetyltransferase n=1 Tax=Lederbergia sp. NSJ-179 TaxID=2931402 RepID=UPI001FD12ADF|nr:GNAT family N-acetyltransferase [Lederbergia sp. NSJ-179]MCJ7842511.1 GNAT family N-acetyltransferase [Lederbergia sp. NSJ-179]